MNLKFYSQKPVALLSLAILLFSFCVSANDDLPRRHSEQPEIAKNEITPSFINWLNTGDELDNKNDIFRFDPVSKKWIPRSIQIPLKDEIETQNKFAFDPVRFTLRSDKDSLASREEFTLTITAEYLDVAPQLMFQFEGSNEFALKMLLPEGFIQTGGTYYDFINGKVDKQNPIQTYTLKGYFESEVQEPCFTLLRNHKGAGIGDSFVRKGGICLNKKSVFAKKNLRKSSTNGKEPNPGKPKKWNGPSFVNNVSINSWVIDVQKGCPSGYDVTVQNYSNTEETIGLFTCPNTCTTLSFHEVTIPANTIKTININPSFGSNVKSFHIHYGLPINDPDACRYTFNATELITVTGNSNPINPIRNRPTITKLETSETSCTSLEYINLIGQTEISYDNSINGYDYKWYMDDVLINDNPVVDPLSPLKTNLKVNNLSEGYYRFNYIVKDKLTQCESQKSISLTYSKQPKAPQIKVQSTPDPATNNPLIINLNPPGSTVTLQVVNPQDCSGNYVWEPANWLTAPSTTGTATFRPLGEFEGMTVKCVAPGGCEAKAVNYAVPRFFGEAPPLIITKDHAVACANQAINILVTNNGGCPVGNNIKWYSVNNGAETLITANSTNTSLSNYIPNETTEVLAKCIFTSGNAVDYIVSTSNKLKILVPKIAWQAGNPPLTACPGSTVSFEVDNQCTEAGGVIKWEELKYTGTGITNDPWGIPNFPIYPPGFEWVTDDSNVKKITRTMPDYTLTVVATCTFKDTDVPSQAERDRCLSWVWAIVEPRQLPNHVLNLTATDFCPEAVTDQLFSLNPSPPTSSDYQYSYHLKIDNQLETFEKNTFGVISNLKDKLKKAGNYTIQLKAKGNNANSTCSSDKYSPTSNEISFNLKNSAIPSFSYVVRLDQITNKTFVTLTNTTKRFDESNSSNLITYAWKYPANTVYSTNTNTIIELNGTSNANFAVTIEATLNGCAVSKTETISLNCVAANLPTTTPTVTNFTNFKPCKNSNSETLTATGCSAGETYLWQISGPGNYSVNIASNNPVPLLPLTISGKYNVKVNCQNNSTGCINSNNTFDHDFHVLDIPAPSFVNVVGNTLNLFDNETITLTASNNNNTPAFNINWPSAIANGQIPTSNQAQTIYSVTYQNGSCMGPNTDIIVNRSLCSPIINVPPPITYLCDGGNTTITAFGGANQFDWYKRNDSGNFEQIITGIIDNPLSINYNNTGNYEIRSCKSSFDNRYWASAPFEIRQLPVVANVSPSNPVVNAGANITIQGLDMAYTQTQALNPIYKFEWFQNSTLRDVSQNYSLTNVPKLAQGNYSLKIKKEIGQTVNGAWQTIKECENTHSFDLNVNDVNCNNFRIASIVNSCDTGNKGNINPVVAGGPATGTTYFIVRNSAGQIVLDWQSSTSLNNLLDGTYKIQAQRRTLPIDQQDNGACYTDEFTAIVACNVALNCNFYIKAVNDGGVESTLLARDPSNNNLFPLNLAIENVDATPLDLSSVNFDWQLPNGINLSHTNIRTNLAGDYTLILTKGTQTCYAALKLTAKPCNDPTDVAGCGPNSTLEPVPDEPNNRLAVLTAGDIVQAGDFDIVIDEITGSASGWTGLGHTDVNALSGPLAIKLTNAVFNNCFQLTNANVTATTPTVETVYDPNWGNMVDVDKVIEDLGNLIQNVINWADKFTNHPEDLRVAEKLKGELDDLNAEFAGDADYTAQDIADIQAEITATKAAITALVGTTGTPGGRMNADQQALANDVQIKARRILLKIWGPIGGLFGITSVNGKLNVETATGDPFCENGVCGIVPKSTWENATFFGETIAFGSGLIDGFYINVKDQLQSVVDLKNCIQEILNLSISGPGCSKVAGQVYEPLKMIYGLVTSRSEQNKVFAALNKQAKEFGDVLTCDGIYASQPKLCSYKKGRIIGDLMANFVPTPGSAFLSGIKKTMKVANMTNLLADINKLDKKLRQVTAVPGKFVKAQVKKGATKTLDLVIEKSNGVAKQIARFKKADHKTPGRLILDAEAPAGKVPGANAKTTIITDIPVERNGVVANENIEFFEDADGEHYARKLPNFNKTALLSNLTNYPKLRAWVNDDLTDIHVDLLKELEKISIDNNLLDKLEIDFKTSSKLADFKKYLIDSPKDLDKTWKKIARHPQLRTDPDVLKSLSKAFDDSYLKNLNLDQIITDKWAPFGFGCKTCAKQTKPWISDLIDNLDNFKQFANLSGGSTVINRLINSGKTQAIGAAWVMKYVKKKNMNPDSFEDFIESTAEFSADITFQGKFVECKSWGAKIAGLGNVPNQMINYFNTQSSLGNFKFEFDPDRYVPTPTDLNQALKANIGLFIDTPQSWTKFNSIFKTTINPMDLNRFDVLIDKITTPEYFSKIINPVD